MVELVRCGTESRHHWQGSSNRLTKRSATGLAQADRDEGRREDGLTTPEREELQSDFAAKTVVCVKSGKS